MKHPAIKGDIPTPTLSWDDKQRIKAFTRWQDRLSGIPDAVKAKPKKKKRGPMPRWQRIYTVQNNCGCLVTRAEPYFGNPYQVRCPHQ